ncbi:MAG: hypothetical protein AAF434_03115 [Pseudomonadota bacterium]
MFRYLLAGLVIALASQQGIANETPALSMGVFKRLTAAEQAMATESFGKAQEAIAEVLEDEDDLSDVDKAYTYHMQALLHLYREKYKLARASFKQAYSLQDVLTEKTRVQIVEILSNLAMQEEDYKDAIKFGLLFLESLEEPTRAAYLTLAVAYYQTEDFKQTIKYLEEVVARFPPDRAVYSTLFASHFELNDLPKATDTVEQMVRLWPETAEYWIQLASLYLERDKVTDSLEIMELAYSQGILLKESELQQYVYLLYEKGLPKKAATILDTAIEKEVVKPTYKSWELLAHLNMEAREADKALDAYLQVSKVAPDGKEDLYIAQLFFDSEKYSDAIRHAQLAIEKGLNLPGNAYMLMAAAYQELSDKENTLISLEEAVKHDETEASARQWLSALEDS